MTKLLLLIVPAVALLTSVAAAAPPDGARRRPDIVIFLSDDQSQLDAQPYGATGLRTPNMQRLAAAGLTFTNAYVASPSCAPSRAALLTGLMPARNAAEANHSRPRADLKKWPAYFQELGYEVVAFGKVSHYRHTADYGFDHFAHDTFHDHAAIPAAVKFLKQRARLRGAPVGNALRGVPPCLPAFPSGLASAERHGGRSLQRSPPDDQSTKRRRIVHGDSKRRDRAAAKPLCLFVGSNWPHVPWPEKHPGHDPDRLDLPAGSIDTPVTREWRARYAAAVTKADDELGLIYDTVQKTLGERTLLLFSSDHGAQWPFAKWNCYEAGVRVPLIVAWPGAIKPRSRTDAMVSWVDFLPTLVEAAGGKPPAGIDGRSFLPVLRGERADHRMRIFTTHTGDRRWNVYPIRSVRIGDWKYILNLRPEFAFTTHIDLPGNSGRRAYFSTWESAAETDPSAAAIVKRYHARPAEELYHLAADPHEQHNLAESPDHAERAGTMRATLETWMRQQGDRRPLSARPRLLSDPKSYGPDAPPGNVPARKTP